jgi:hypothetical protein
MGMFVFTQQFGLTKKKAVHFTLLAVYIAVAVATFSIIGWSKAFALISIPMAEYLGALAGWGLFALVPRIKNKRKIQIEAGPKQPVVQ